MSTFSLYRHFDADGTLLYVGVTDNLARRAVQHAASSPWFGAVVEVDTEEYARKADALKAESEAIAAERPLHNRINHRVADPSSPVVALLVRWPTRKDVWDDARAADPSLDFVAVHRWFKRNSVPSQYWRALLTGAARRGIAVSADDFVDAHALLTTPHQETAA